MVLSVVGMKVGCRLTLLVACGKVIDMSFVLTSLEKDLDDQGAVVLINVAGADVLRFCIREYRSIQGRPALL